MKNWVHHIVLSVSDVSRSTEFYKKALGWHIRSSCEDYTEFNPPDDLYGNDALFCLVKATEEQNKFSSANVGLHHFAFMTESEEELKEIEKRMRENGVEMEDNGITDDGYGGTAIFCRDPDGMVLEFHLR